MPQKTSYGYSGANAYPAKSNQNVALYAAGGAVAGVVVGAGAYYAYDSMYRSESETWYRRRRTQPAKFCVVPATAEAGSLAGAFMECPECIRRFGACGDTSSCYNTGGCGYELQSSINRDDIVASGFVPADFKSPLKINITRLAGTGINTEICPATTQAQLELNERFNRTNTFTADLFITLTEQDVLNTGSGDVNCEQDTGYPCKNGARPLQKGLASCYGEHEECREDYTCHCQSGYCIRGTGRDMQCVLGPRGSANMALRSVGAPSLAALLFPALLVLSPRVAIRAGRY